MASESVDTLSSLPPPSSQEYGAPAGEQSRDPEEHETTSDPKVDTNSSAVLEDEEKVSTSSSVEGDKKSLSFDEGEAHDSGKKGFLRENFDSLENSNDVIMRVGEKFLEAEEEEKLYSVRQNPIGNDTSGGDVVAKGVHDGDGESRVKKNENMGGGNEQSNSFGNGVPKKMEPKEPKEGDSNFTSMGVSASSYGAADSAYSFNQNIPEGVESMILKSQSSVVASGEVGGYVRQGCATDVDPNEKSVNLDEGLPANNAMAPETVELEADPYAVGAEKFGSPGADVIDRKGTAVRCELDMLDEAEKKPVKPVEVAVDEDGLEGSNGEVNLLKVEALEFDCINSNDDVAGQDPVESLEIVKYESAKEIAAEKEDLDSEDTSSPCRDENLSNVANDSVAWDEITQNSSIEAQILAKEAVVGDNNIKGTGSENLPQLSNIDKLDATPLNEGTTIENLSQKGAADEADGVSFNEISKLSTLDIEIANEKVVIDSEHASRPGQIEATVQSTADVDLKSGANTEVLPVIIRETVVGDDNTRGSITESLSQMNNTDMLDIIFLNQETAEENVVVGSRDAPSSSEGEPEGLLIADNGDLNSAIEEGTHPVIWRSSTVVNSAVEEESHPVIAKSSVAGDENTTESLPQKSDTDELDSTSLSQQSAEDKELVGSEHTSSHVESEPELQLASNPTVELETFPVTAKEFMARDVSLPQILELEQKVELDAWGSQVNTGESHASAVEEVKYENEDVDRRVSDGPSRVAILDGPEAAKQILREMERISSSSESGIQGSHNYSTSVDGQIVSDSDEVVDSDEDGDGSELFDSAALAALLKAATSSSDGTVTVTAQDAARIFSGDRPVGLGTSAPSLRPSAPRSARPSLFTPSETIAVEVPDHSMDDDEKRIHEKVEQIRVKFLRLVHRLGHSPTDAVAGQVLYRLSLAEGIKQGRQMSRAFSIESAKKQALQLEEEGKDHLEFSCNVLVLGKTGVGKSATINSIFGGERSQTNPFQLATASVREISGVVDGVRVRVIDTPGLKASVMDQSINRKILSSIKKFIKKCPPDIVLYVDRMDTPTRDFNDLPLLRSITSILGSSIWFNAIVALTHAGSAPPDGPNGSPLGYEVFVTQRSHVVQQSVRQAAGDMRLMNPVALVENHPSCRRNREGERILPNGLSWRPQLLLLSYASKILSEANSLLKLQDPSPGKLFGGFRLRSPPLPFLLSSLLQSRAHPKRDQVGDNADSDIELDEFSDAEQDEEVDEYDQLPPFKPLTKSQIAKLTKEQKKAYFDEYDYRVKLLQKKQWKETLMRLKETKKKGKDDPDEFTSGDMPEYYDQDGSPAAVPIPLPDMVLPPSFDCDNSAFRYRFLEPTSQFLSRPVLDTHGWDHDCGYDGVSIEENLTIADWFPTSMAVQITKDKKEFNIHLDSSVAVKHGEHGSTLAGFDIQSVGKQLAYILRGETKFNNLKKHKTAAGVSVTFLGETIATGLKVEDRISFGKRLGLVASTGAVRAQGDVAYGANLEARLRDKDYPIGQALSTFGLSLMKWKSDLALGTNLQSQFSVGRNSKMAVRVGLNNKLTGQITIRTSTSDHLQIAFAGIIPLAISIYRNVKSNESYMGH